MRLPSGELARKAVHVGMGLLALLLAFLTWWQALILALLAFFHNLWLLPRYARRLLRVGRDDEARDVGILLYPASVALLILLFHRRLEIVAAAWALMSFGDGFAAIVGRTIGGPKLPWNRAKTWSGLLAFVVCGFLAARFLYVWTALGTGLWGGDGGASTMLPPALPETLHTAGAPSPAGGLLGEDAARDSPLAAGSSVFQGSLGALFLAACTGGWTGPLVAMIVVTTVLAAVLESLPLGVDDNALVPLVSAGFLFSITLFDPAAWAMNRQWVLANLPWAAAINGALALAAYAARSVSVSGVVGGVLLGGALYSFGGWRSFMMLVVFFVLGTAATKMGHGKKAALGIAQEKGGRRGARNAVANCGVGALLAFVAATSSHGPLATLGLVAAFATAACDTVSSEIGQAYGRSAFLITSFRRVPAGTDGAVSLEGTLAGAAAAFAVAVAAVILGLVSPAGGALVVVAALFGSTLESYIGATWQRAKRIDNEAINFANTVAGALFAIAIPAILTGIPFTSPGPN